MNHLPTLLMICEELGLSPQHHISTMTSPPAKREKLDLESPQSREARLGIPPLPIYNGILRLTIHTGHLLSSVSSKPYLASPSHAPLVQSCPLNGISRLPYAIPKSDGQSTFHLESTH